jgi:guanyl-specific ribonuclease Sa
MVTIISLSDGQTVKTVELPLVEHLTVDTIESGGFVAWSKDGRVERLSPKSAGK